MKNKKVLVFALLLSILLLQNISAITTNFEVSTLREHTLKAEFFSVGNGIPELYESKDIYTPNGEITFDFAHDSDEFVLNVFLMKGTKIKLHERFSSVESGKDYDLVFTPIDISLGERVIENSSDEDEVEVVVENNSNSEPLEVVEKLNETKEVKDIVEDADNNAGLISGQAIFEGGIVNSWVFYAIVVIIIIVIVVFIYFKFKKKGHEDLSGNTGEQKQEQQIKVKKLSELKKEKQEYAKSKQERIDELEQKIQQLQGELTDIKKSNQIAELQEKVKKDKEALEKAEREEQGITEKIEDSENKG